MSSKVGGLSPVHSAKIGGGARAVSTEAQKVWIVNPATDEKQEVARHVANDMVAHCGWKWTTKTGEAPTVKEAVQLGDGTVVAPPAVEVKDDDEDGEDNGAPVEEVKDPAIVELEELRAKAEAAGIDVKGTWGKKRILAALEEVAAPTETVVLSAE